MSRGDFGSNPYRVQATRDGDSEYLRLSNCVSNNIQRMTQNVADIQRLVSRIGTAQDVPEVFDDLQNKQKTTGMLAKETSHYLKELSNLEGGTPQEQRQRKIQQEKLRENFTNLLNNFQKVQRQAAEKERASVQRARAISMDSQHQPEHVESAPIRPPSDVQLQAQTEAELSVEMIRERERAIRQLESDILDVNEIFKDMALMVHEQGEMIDSIESHVDRAAGSVEEGVVQLSKAKNYQKAARKKICCLLLILLVVAVVIGIIIWQTTK